MNETATPVWTIEPDDEGQQHVYVTDNNGKHIVLTFTVDGDIYRHLDEAPAYLGLDLLT